MNMLHQHAGLHKGNPFIEITSPARWLIAVYFIFWRIVPPLFVDYGAHGESSWVVISYLSSHLIYEIILLFPFCVRDFAGTRIGWLHPLIFIPALTVLLGLVKAPISLLAPLSFGSDTQAYYYHPLLTGRDENFILSSQVKLKIIDAIALISMYGGFAIFERRVASSGVNANFGINSFRFYTLVALCFIVVMFFLQKQGGILMHMTSLASGRFRMRELSGPFLIINNILPFLFILWYLYKPSVIKSPVFVGAFVVVCALQFVVGGSRSSLFIPIAGLLTAWMMKNQKVPALRVILLGIMVMLLLGILGEIRRSGSDGMVDFELLTNFDIRNAYQLSQEELENRDHGASLAIAGLVPDDHRHVLGSTYVAAILFWVPRLLWDSKPRGAGAQVAAIFYHGFDDAAGYQGGGYPPGAAAEAFWNFGWFGVVVIYIIFGIYLRYCGDYFFANPLNPKPALLLILVYFVLRSPSTTSIVAFAQSFILIYLSIFFVKARQKRIND